ncbi:GCNT3-like protein [Mya arenaria]|uniref:GCNT3-like protein n=1 Tax=Mya arenaria TaxID=6604 RepID=A0ABY7DVD5_MYAAR|nr:GCNT3-like protein [Mya arenaria]
MSKFVSFRTAVVNRHSGMLLSSDSKEMERAIDYLEGKNKQFAHFPSIQYDTMEKLAGRETPKAKGVQLPYGTEEDTDFPVAFYIPFHENVVQLQRLLYIIHRPQNIYCVHVDDKLSSKDFEAVYRIANCYKNVFLTSRREIMVYGSVTEIRAELNCMEDLVNSGHRWKYLIHFTAKSFPLMTNSELVEALKSHKGKNIFHSNWPEEHIQFKRRHILLCRSGHYVRNTCVFSVRDLATLTQRRELVANKFDIAYDPIVYMCMEQWITNKTRGNHLQGTKKSLRLH